MIWQLLKKGHFHNCITRSFHNFSPKSSGDFWQFLGAFWISTFLIVLILDSIVRNLSNALAPL